MKKCYVLNICVHHDYNEENEGKTLWGTHVIKTEVRMTRC